MSAERSQQDTETRMLTRDKADLRRELQLALKKRDDVLLDYEALKVKADSSAANLASLEANMKTTVTKLGELMNEWREWLSPITIP